jgi:2-polyprenyl-6-methoxyphenol hydroxylase-like FAD-dependent oxidoreductase
MPLRGERAIVLGASMGGLLAATVLSESYRTVTVVERDVLPHDPVARRGVPQGRLIHALLARGAQILDELLPGVLDELVNNGATKWDGDYAKLCFSVGGHQFLRTGRTPDPDSMPFYFPEQAAARMASAAAGAGHRECGHPRTPRRAGTDVDHRP